MRKFSIITILTLLLYAINVYADPSFEIDKESINLSSPVDETLISGFKITNTGTEDLAIDFSGFTLTGPSTLTITELINIPNITSGSEEEVTFSIVILNDKEHGLYSGSIIATSGSLSEKIDINIEVTSSLTVSTSVSEINLGNANLKSTKKGTFEITNTGNAEITGITFEFSNLDSTFQTEKSDYNLAVDATETINFNITIPSDSSTGNITLGTLTLISEELSLSITLFDIKANVGGGLAIQDLDVSLVTRDSKSDSHVDVGNGIRLKFDDEDIGPGSELVFNFNIENRFKEIIDINDITIKLTIEEIDDGSDIEEESDNFDLDPDSNIDVDIIVDIPLSVINRIYNVIVEVSGKDKNSATHTAQMNFKLDVNKKTRDIVVAEASIFPQKIKCSGTLTLTAIIKNIGLNIENDALIGIKSDDLNLNYLQGNIEIDEDPFGGDDEFKKTISINIDKGTEPGTYPIEVNSYLQDGILWDTKKVNLIVESCNQKIEDEIPDADLDEDVEETKDEFEPVENIDEEKDEISTESISIPILEPATSIEIQFTKRPIFWITIIIFNALLIVVAAIFISNSLIKKKDK